MAIIIGDNMDSGVQSVIKGTSSTERRCILGLDDAASVIHSFAQASTKNETPNITKDYMKCVVTQENSNVFDVCVCKYTILSQF